MNSTLLRGLLNAVAIELIIAWVIAALIGHRLGWLLVIAACLFLMTGYMAFSQKLDADSDFRRACRDAGRLLATNDRDIVDRARNSDILRHDPRAYPLTKRAVWPNTSGAPE